MWETVLKDLKVENHCPMERWWVFDFHVTVWRWAPTTKEAKGHAPQEALSVILYVTRLYQANDKGELFEDIEFRTCSGCFNIKVWRKDFQITVPTL